MDASDIKYKIEDIGFMVRNRVRDIDRDSVVYYLNENWMRILLVLTVVILLFTTVYLLLLRDSSAVDSCEDGIKNGGEMFVDCGGTCDPCSDFIKCNNVKVESIRDTCLYEFAMDLSDVEICKMLTSKKLMARCFGSLAIKSGDYSLCELAGEEIDTCNQVLADNLDDPSYCASFINKTLADSCFIFFAFRRNDSAFCFDTTSTDTKNACFLDFSFSKLNESLCGEISEDKIRQLCFFEHAILQNRSELCNNTGEQVVVDSCRLYFTDGRKDASFCEGLMTPVAKYKCLISVAVHNGEFESCALIDNDKYYTDCLYHVSTEVLNPDLCDEIDSEQYNVFCSAIWTDTDCSVTDGDWKSRCYSQIATTYRDQRYCGKITDSKKRDKCYSHLSMVMLDPDICSEISNIAARDECKHDVHIIVMNWSGCTYLASEVEKNRCLASIAVSWANPYVCSIISTEVGRYDCFKEQVDTNADARVCLYMSFTDWSNMCPTLTGYDTGITSNYCKEPEDGFWKEKCIITFALSKKSILTCNRIYNDEQRANCISLVSLKNKNYDDCSRIATMRYRDRCYRSHAKEFNDPQICYRIDDTDMQFQCIQDVDPR